MKIADLNGKQVCILGHGREGQAMEQAIKEDAPKAKITIRDQDDGEEYLEGLDAFDVIIKSPGIPPKPEFKSVTKKMTSATQIFLDEVADTGATVVGVTGSKGKSTVSSLITHILQTAGRDVSLIGNIGEPAITHRKEAVEGKIFVMELSSYQLMNITKSPHIAVITSFFPEHLDYHGSVHAYMEAKKNIARHQKHTDFMFFNAGNEGTKSIAAVSAGRQVGITAKDSPIPLEASHLIGHHNLGNIALASAVAAHLGIDKQTIALAAMSFAPLPHRLQSLGQHHGLEWVDDSISTTPESTIAALEALGDGVRVLLLGGQDRGNDFAGLAERVKNSKVQLVILFPQSGKRIRKALAEHGANIEVRDAKTMAEAVTVAKTIKSGICLLSPASPSYNQYKNFEERGQAFVDAITK